MIIDQIQNIIENCPLCKKPLVEYNSLAIDQKLESKNQKVIEVRYRGTKVWIHSSCLDVWQVTQRLLSSGNTNP